MVLPKAALKSLAVSVFYGTSSVMLSTLNKALLSGYKFDGYFSMIAASLLLTLAVCSISRRLGNPFDIPAADLALFRAAAPMGILSVLNVGVGLVGLQLVNIPMFFCLRRLVAPMVLLYEFITLGRVAERSVQASVSFIVIGVLVAGASSLSADILGYSLTMLNNLFSAAASVMQKRFSERTKLSTIGIVYANALVAAPLCVTLALVTGEYAKIAAFPHVENGGFWAAFAVSCAMGLMLTYSSVLSTTYNSPLATSVTGNAKDIATTAIGWLAFSDFQPTAQAIVGIGISFAGAFSFSYVKLRQQMGASTVVRPSPAAEKAAALKAEEAEAFLRHGGAGAVASPLGTIGGTGLGGGSGGGSAVGRVVELADVELRVGHRD